MYTILLLFIVNYYCFQMVQLEIYSSTSDFLTFLQWETNTLTSLESYVDIETSRIEKLKKSIADYKNTIENAVSNGVENPIQHYATMKNIVHAWQNIESKVKNEVHEDILKDINEDRLAHFITAPTEEDLHMAKVGLSRLQNMYNLKSEDIVVGNFMGVIRTNLKLDANDCFEMGLLNLDTNDYNVASSWFEQSLKQLAIEDHKTVEKMEVLKRLAYSSFKERHSNKTIEIMSEIIKLSKDDEDFFEYITNYEKPPQNPTKSNKIEDSSQMVPDEFNKTLTSNWNKIDERIALQVAYKALCNGENTSNNEIRSTIKCYYKKDRPFLRLAPLKVEVLNLVPGIYLFHDVISNEEIDTILRLAKTRLKRAEVGAGKSEYRVAKNTFIKTYELDILPIINKRIEDMTNLDTEFAEALQIANYGIGGHYGIHYDYFQLDSTDYRIENKNRIATMLFYLSTPNVGGATVFPEAKVTFMPTKNNAILWYNLLMSGEPDRMTKHAGCPILSGSKWIANKWIRERGQEKFGICDENRYKRISLKFD